jgi:uncharacterized protein (TIGR03067 family)
MKQALALSLGILLLGAAPRGGGDASKDDLKKLQGKWKAVERIIDGKKIEAQGHWTISGNEITYDTDPDVKAVFKLDAGTKPKSLDFDHIAKDPTKTIKGFKCIYEIVGDTFKLCVQVNEGKDRPKTFDSKEGSGHNLHVMKRVKD